jgi:outer membrane protein assembly factor BamB
MYTRRAGLRWSHLVALGVLVAAPASAARAQQAEVTINDTMVSPESVTSSRDGAIIFGSTTKGTVYRAAPNAAAADAWIQASTAGLQRVLGVFADDAHQTLWVCSSAPPPPRGAAPPATPAPAGETGVKSFNLATGAAKGSFAFPGGTGTCNDMAIAADGTLYATDTSGARVLRLKPGATTMDLWAADPLLTSADGIAVLGDGAVYVNTFASGTLVRIAVGAGGAASAPVKLETSRPLVRPDGMRSVTGTTMLLIEGDGHLDEVTIRGTQAEITTIKDGFTGPTAVTLVGNRAYVLEGRTKVTAVPYPAAR